VKEFPGNDVRQVDLFIFDKFRNLVLSSLKITLELEDMHLICRKETSLLWMLLGLQIRNVAFITDHVPRVAF
jgi:hypothetical protein